MGPGQLASQRIAQEASQVETEEGWFANAYTGRLFFTTGMGAPWRLGVDDRLRGLGTAINPSPALTAEALQKAIDLLRNPPEGAPEIRPTELPPVSLEMFRRLVDGGAIDLQGRILDQDRYLRIAFRASDESERP